MKKKMTVSALALTCMSASAFSATHCGSDVLPSWGNSASKDAIVTFVNQTSSESSMHFVPIEDRIAVFDNDGTLWSEKPAYFQLAFALDQIKSMAKHHPEWKTQEPFMFVLQDDLESFKAGGHHAIEEVVKATHSGVTVEEFQETVKAWIEVTKDPRFGKRYTELTYKPMKELLNYLQEHGFTNYIVSGGGVDFMRSWAPEVYGIPSQHIIGSATGYTYNYNDGQPTITKDADIALLNDKTIKPESIAQFIGKKPILAVGNSDGDHAMMQWATSQKNSMAMIVHHTDAQREWQYDRDSSVGRLDKAMDEANVRDNWHLIDMKSDWCTVY